MKIQLLVIVCFLFSLGVTSCGDASVYYEGTVAVDNQIWNAKDTVTFEFEIEDTTQKYDFYLNLRTTTSYGYSNFWAFVQLESDNMIAFDTINVPLADPSGKWKGDASASMVENNILFMDNARMNSTGTYKISFVQGMRENELSEISDVGLTIKKSK